MRKRVRRRGLAEIFQVNIRTIDSWVRRGVIPRPHYLKGSAVPFWFQDQIDRSPARQRQQSEKEVTV